MSKVIDAEKLQEYKRLMKESSKAYIEAKRQLKISDELWYKAIAIHRGF